MQVGLWLCDVLKTYFVVALRLYIRLTRRAPVPAGSAANMSHRHDGTRPLPTTAERH